jgi:hypothetical protein
MNSFIDYYEKPSKEYTGFNCGKPIQYVRQSVEGTVINQLFYTPPKNDTETAYLLSDIQEQERKSQAIIRERELRDILEYKEANELQKEMMITERDDMMVKEFEKFKEKLRKMKILSPDQKAVLETEFLKDFVMNSSILNPVSTSYNIKGNELNDDLGDAIEEALYREPTSSSDDNFQTAGAGAAFFQAQEISGEDTGPITRSRGRPRVERDPPPVRRRV